MQISGPGRIEAGQSWSMTISGVADFNNLVIDLLGANGGIFRRFGNGRDAIIQTYKFRGIGKTWINITARNAKLQQLESVIGQFEVTQAGTLSAGIDTRSTAEPLTLCTDIIMPNMTIKPPLAIDPHAALNHGAPTSAPSVSSAPNRSDPLKGWFMGPDEADAGESVSITLDGGSDADYANLSATNASISSSTLQLNGASAYVTATMGSGGTASINAEIKTVAHETVHTLQHSIRIRSNSRADEPAGSKTSRSLLEETENAMRARLEARLKGRFKKT